jgi:hypothetical protein
MSKRKLIRRLTNLIEETDSKALSNILPTHLIVSHDNSINISSKAIKELGGNPEDYEDNRAIPGLEDKLVADKIAYITDPILFTPERTYRAYPDYKLQILTF